MGILSPISRPNNHSANLTLNQSIYANTVALPKMNGGAVRHGSNGSNGSSSKSTNGGLNTSKLSSSNSPATTNQTKTSYMDSSRDHSHHELENTQLSPIARYGCCNLDMPIYVAINNQVFFSWKRCRYRDFRAWTDGMEWKIWKFCILIFILIFNRNTILNISVINTDMPFHRFFSV